MIDFLQKVNMIYDRNGEHYHTSRFVIPTWMYPNTRRMVDEDKVGGY